MNIYNNIIELAKKTKYQNLFIVAKEIGSIKLFENNTDLSKLQELFLSYLYTFESINHDIIIDKISQHVLDNQIFWESYLLYKKDKRKKDEKDNKKKDLSLVAGKKVKFPKKRK